MQYACKHTFNISILNFYKNEHSFYDLRTTRHKTLETKATKTEVQGYNLHADHKSTMHLKKIATTTVAPVTKLISLAVTCIPALNNSESYIPAYETFRKFHTFLLSDA